MVITGGEGSEALVTEYSGIAHVTEVEGVLGTSAKEVTLIRNSLKLNEVNIVCLTPIEGGRYSKNTSTTLPSHSTL